MTVYPPAVYTAIIEHTKSTYQLLWVHTQYVTTQVKTYQTLVLCSQSSFLVQGVIACSISARTKKGSGIVHSTDSFLTPPLVQRC